MTHSHLIIRNSPVVDECIVDIKANWRDVALEWDSRYEVIESIVVNEARWGDDTATIVRHRDTDILFEILWRSDRTEVGEDDFHGVRAVVATKQTRVVYDIEDASGTTLHESLTNGRFEVLV